MALNLTKKPDTVALAGNGLNYTVETDNYRTSAGTKAKWLIKFTEDAPAHGDIFNLISKYFGIEFEFRTSPDESGNQLPVAPIPFVPATYTLTLQEALAKNYYIAKYCEIVTITGSASFYIRFRDNGAVNIDSDTPAGVLDITDTEGSEPAYRENYKLGCLVEVDGSIAGEDELVPNSSNQAEFDISDYIEPLCSSDFSFPAGDDLIVELVDGTKQFVFKYFEKYGTTPVPGIIHNDEARVAIPGGIDDKMIQQLLSDETTWIDEHTSGKKFLTWMPNNALCKPGDLLRLFWLCRSTDVAISLMVRYTPNEGPPGEYVQKAYAPMTAGKIYEIVIDPDKLFTSEQLSDMRGFDLYLKDASDTVISELRTYFIDGLYYSRRLQFVAANSYRSAYDVFNATGKLQSNIELENYTVIDFGERNKQQSRSKKSQVFTFNTGFVAYDQLHWWQEFLISERRWMIAEGLRIPVRILSGKFFMFKDGENLYSLQLEIEVWHNEKYVSTIPATAFSDSFNTGGGIPVVPGSGGHIILDNEGNEMPQRRYLKFTQSGDVVVTVTDGESENVTIVDINCIGGSGESMWEPDGANNVKPTNEKKVNVAYIDGLADVATSGNYSDLNGTPEGSQTLTDAATISWNGANGNNANVTLGGNRTLANITNPVANRVYTLYCKQDATGNRSLAFDTYFFFPGDVVPETTKTANAVDVFVFKYIDSHYFALINFIPNV